MRRKGSGGFTLLEMMVGIAVASLVMLAAVGFAQSQIRTMGYGNQNLEMMQGGRAALDLLTRDLVNAGAGLGYDETGAYAGIRVGEWTMPAGATFNSANVDLDYGAYVLPTDDIMIRMADGEFVSITRDLGGQIFEVCSPSTFESGGQVVIRGADGISARAVLIDGDPAIDDCPAEVTCGQSGDKCERLELVDADEVPFSSGASSDFAVADYAGGSISGGFRSVVWFVAVDDQGRGQLRRAVDADCAERDVNCGELVADNVETLQMRLVQFDTDTGTWNDVDPITGIATLDRVRVDVEMIIRARTTDDAQHDTIALALEPGFCVPGGDDCDQVNRIRRLALRSSVEVKNSGLTQVAR